MKHTLTIIFVLAIVSSALAQDADPASYPGYVEVESVGAYPGDSFGVKVWLKANTIDVSAITLPLKFDGQFLNLDSVSMNNTVWGVDFSGYSIIDNEAHTCRVTVLPNDVVYPLPSVSVANGVVAVLFFSLSPGSTPHTAVVDSVYADTVLAGGIHIYTRIDISDNTGGAVYLPEFVPGEIESLVPTAAEDVVGNLALPTEYAMDQNYPNPFNPSTVIRFAMPTAGHARLNVFNILGQQVSSLIDRGLSAGWHEVELDGSELPSGIYFYRLDYGSGALTRKMMLVK